jgi:hypothetical protein
MSPTLIATYTAIIHALLLTGSPITRNDLATRAMIGRGRITSACKQLAGRFGLAFEGGKWGFQGGFSVWEAMTWCIDHGRIPCLGTAELRAQWAQALINAQYAPEGATVKDILRAANDDKWGPYYRDARMDAIDTI